MQKSSNDGVLLSAHCFESERNKVFQKLSMIRFRNSVWFVSETQYDSFQKLSMIRFRNSVWFVSETQYDSFQKFSMIRFRNSVWFVSEIQYDSFQKFSMIPSSRARLSGHVYSWLPQKRLFSSEWVSIKNAELWANLMGIYYMEIVRRSINYGICL